MTSNMTAPKIYLFIFYLEKVVHTSGYSLIVPGTLVYFLLKLMWKGWEILFKMCDIWKICEKDAVDSPQLICSLTLIQSQKRLKDVLMQQKFSWMMAFIFDKSWSWVKCRFHWFSAKETMAGLKTFDFLHNNAVKSAKWRFSTHWCSANASWYIRYIALHSII